MKIILFRTWITNPYYFYLLMNYSKSMSSRRSKFEIYIDILALIKNGVVLPTRIMYSANLSWKPLRQILKSLVAQDLIDEEAFDDGDKRTKKIYRITEKGDNVLKYFNRAKDLMELEVAPPYARMR
jgi:predicted transcriptional regulator